MFVSVFAVFSVFCLQMFRVYHVGTRGKKNFPSGMGEIGIREPDG